LRVVTIDKLKLYTEFSFQKKLKLAMGVCKGGKNRHLPPLEIGTKKENFLENVKSAV